VGCGHRREHQHRPVAEPEPGPQRGLVGAFDEQLGLVPVRDDADPLGRENYDFAMREGFILRPQALIEMGRCIGKGLHYLLRLCHHLAGVDTE
jgi:hypothetical protein